MNRMIIKKEEKRGIWAILVMYFLSWGAMMTPYGAIRFVAWLSLGLIGFTIWRMFDGLIERQYPNDYKKEVSKN